MGTSPHHPHPQPSFTKKLISKLVFILIPLLFFLHLYLYLYFFSQPQQQPQIIKQESIELPPPPHQIKNQQQCNLTVGQWVPTTHPPLYNGTSCSTIKPGQNCMAHGRPDTGYLFYRWQPHHCNLPLFQPLSFLNLLRNRHLAFIGDSMARNQLESLLCLLSTASSPELLYRNGEDNNKFRQWVFASHNFTLSVYWSPFLVKGVEKSSGLNHNKLYLDYADERWLSEISAIDVVVFSVGHWFLHPAIYIENEEVLGCHHCPELNNTSEIGFFDVFRKAVRTTLKEVKKRVDHKFVVLTTFSPAHFEGEWDKAGACPKKEPFREGEKQMEYMDAEMRKIEVEEVEAIMLDIKTSLRFEALDVTRLAMMRPDGHPGPYMYPNPFADGIKDRVQNDCVHWCLPGPIDAWNEILLAMVDSWKKTIIV